jgi:predicted nucleic acid-binding protein
MDSSAFYALLDENDPNYRAATAYLESASREFVSSDHVFVEIVGLKPGMIP